MFKHRLSLGLAAGAFAVLPAATAEAYIECGNPPGPVTDVTAMRVGCSDARSFARKVASRDVIASRWISLPGWRRYYARVRRAGGEYDVRATRGNKVIRFQYRGSSSGGGGGGCDPNYAGACLRPDSSDYDCEGGSGDGPDYTGYVEVVGDDHYDLDRDGDGVACES